MADTEAQAAALQAFLLARLPEADRSRLAHWLGPLLPPFNPESPDNAA
jgi:hypothetical protein